MYKSTLKILIIFLILIAVGLYSFIQFYTYPQITLDQVVNKSLKDSHGKYSIVIKNLKSNETYLKDAHKKYYAGSLYKLWIMAVVFEKLQKGQLSDKDLITNDIATLNKKFNIDQSDAELTEGNISLTVDEALKQMITISHNYAALLLTEELGLSNIKLFLERYSLKESIISDDLPTSTASDIALFLEKLYKGELANQEFTKRMLDLLKMQKLNNKLPKYLPKDLVIAHKTGELDFLSHDAGIVYAKNGDYIIVVFSESNNPSGAEDRIARISKAVYEYFITTYSP